MATLLPPWVQSLQAGYTPMPPIKYPWLDENEVKKLKSYIGVWAWVSETQLYQKMIKEKLAKQEKDKKIALKNEMAYQAEVKKDPVLKSKVTLADVDDTIVEVWRELMESKGITKTYTDAELLQKFKTKYGDETYTDILNGKTTVKRVLGLEKEKGKGLNSVIQATKNVVWAVWQSATGLPMAVARIASKGVEKKFIAAGIPKDQAKEFTDWFIQYLEESRPADVIWADKESTGYKRTKWASDVIQTLAWTTMLSKWATQAVSGLMWPASTIGGWIARWAIQWAVTWAWATQLWSVVSQGEPASALATAWWAALWGIIGWTIWWVQQAKVGKLQRLITEPETSRNIKKAAEQGRIKFKSKTLFWQKPAEITPTEKVANAKGILEKELPNISTKNPQKLLNNIENLWLKRYTALSDKLKKIPVWSMTKVKADITKQMDSIIKDSEWSKFFAGSGKTKQFQTVINDVKVAKTADDIWRARIEFDNLFPESVKTFKPTSFQAETLRGLRQDIRWQMNNGLDNIVREYGDDIVKWGFYDMSSLMEAKENLLANMPRLVKWATGLITKKDALKFILIGWLWTFWASKLIK